MISSGFRVGGAPPPMTLEAVEFADFHACVGDPVELSIPPQAPVPAEVLAVRSLGRNCLPDGTTAARESFSVLFRAPPNWRYPQTTYRVSHSRLGELSMFLVPVGPDESGMQLEAVFNFT